jgi:hypothetical protein
LAKGVPLKTTTTTTTTTTTVTQTVTSEAAGPAPRYRGTRLKRKDRSYRDISHPVTPAAKRSPVSPSVRPAVISPPVSPSVRPAAILPPVSPKKGSGKTTIRRKRQRRGRPVVLSQEEKQMQIEKDISGLTKAELAFVAAEKIHHLFPFVCKTVTDNSGNVLEGCNIAFKTGTKRHNCPCGRSLRSKCMQVCYNFHFSGFVQTHLLSPISAEDTSQAP